jgi:hypothetical protein
MELEVENYCVNGKKSKSLIINKKTCNNKEKSKKSKTTKNSIISVYNNENIGFIKEVNSHEQFIKSNIIDISNTYQHLSIIDNDIKKQVSIGDTFSTDTSNSLDCISKTTNELGILSETDNDKLKISLKKILDDSKINHQQEILKLDTLKNAHIYCKINNLSGQITGSLIENFIKIKYNMKKNEASNCIGDLKYNNINYEIKVSTGGNTNKKFNYVQLRMNHDCEYIFTAYYISEENINNLGELFIFKISKEELKKNIIEYGTYAHGTKSKLGNITIEDINNSENNKEYALRFTYNHKNWKQLLKYRINDISDIIDNKDNININNNNVN